MNRVRYGYAAAAWMMDYHEYTVRICLALLYPPQALVATPVVVSYLADALRNAYSSVWQEVYSEYYCILVAAWVHTLQEDKLFVHLDDRTLRHFDVLDTSKLKDAPDGEAKYVLYGKMRQAVTAFFWREVLNDVVWRDRDSGEARQVRIPVDPTKEYGFCLRLVVVRRLT